MKKIILSVFIIIFSCSCNRHIWQIPHPPFPYNLVNEYPFSFFPKNINETLDNGNKKGLWIIFDDTNSIISFIYYGLDTANLYEAIYENCVLSHSEKRKSPIYFSFFSDRKNNFFPEKINQFSKNGEKDGMWVEHYLKNDSLSCEIISIKNYRNGKLHGDFVEYEVKIQSTLAGKYKKGNKCGWWENYSPWGLAGVYLFNKRGKLLWSVVM